MYVHFISISCAPLILVAQPTAHMWGLSACKSHIFPSYKCIKFRSLAMYLVSIYLNILRNYLNISTHVVAQKSCVVPAMNGSEVYRPVSYCCML
jgi:hypothetical protein